MADLCGQCNQEFDNEAGYLDHTCDASGYKPTDPENLGEGFAAVSAAALARGEARKSKETPV